MELIIAIIKIIYLLVVSIGVIALVLWRFFERW